MLSTNYQDLVIISGITNDSWSLDFTDQEFKDLSIMPTLPHRLLGPYKIAHRVNQYGYLCKVVDFFNFIPNEKLIPLLEKLIGPKTILSISTNHLMYNNSTSEDKIVDKIKQVLEYFQQKFSTKILIGGYNSRLWKQVFDADFILEGAGEDTVIDLLNSQFNFGINKTKINKWNIKTCDFKWHEGFNIIQGETLPLETARGCIYKCKFCRFEEIGKKRGSYVRDITLVKESLVEAYEKFKITNYQIIDATFNDDIDNVNAWHRITMSLPFKLKYATHIRADLVEKYNSAELLAESGLIGALIGLESLHPKAAKSVGKTWSAKKAKEFLPTLKQSSWKNVNMTLSLIIGLPEEDFRSVHKTYRWIEENNFSNIFYPLHIVDPEVKQYDNFSEFDLRAKNYGYKFDKDLIWKNPITDFYTCMKVGQIINNKLSETTPVWSWESNLFEGLGIPQIATISQSKRNFYQSQQAKIAIKNFIETYTRSFG